MKNIKIFLISVAALVLTSCSSINLAIPLATIESPEVIGKTWTKELGPTLEPAVGIAYVANAGARPIDLNSPARLGDTHTLQHHAKFGIVERFQWGLSLGLDTVSNGGDSNLSSSVTATGKFQFFGTPRLEAKAGDWSAGVFAKIGLADASETGDQTTTFGPGGFGWKADVQAWTGLVGVTSGYRFTDQWLVYGGGSYQNIRSSVKVTQDPATDNSDPGGSYSVDRNGFSTAFGLGSQFSLGKVFSFHLKLMQVHLEIEGLPTEDSLTAAGGFGFMW